jgi:hypothetical protein
MPSSTLYNPLDEFNSYSVHYVMLACRTTEDARVFTDEKNNAATLQAIEQVNLLGEAVPYGNANTAFLMMDTRRFSQFTIDNLKYEVLINGIEKAGSHGNLATTINMTILDSVGISFINFLQWLMDEKMQANFDGIIYMLRVIFVGHKSDGSTSTVQTVTIPMHLTKLELNLDYAKGAYEAEFMPNVNFDAQEHSRWLNISSASSYFTGAGNNTLGGMVDSFEAALNDASTRYYNDASSLLEKAGRTRNAKGKFGRQVQYMITIPEAWRAFEFTGSGTAGATETVFKKQLAERDGTAKTEVAKPAKATDSHMSVESGMQITEVLDLMFRQVKEIADLGNGRKTQKGEAVTFYKHIVGITSDDNVVVVHVDVVPFVVPNVVVEKQATAQPVSQNEADFYDIDENGVRRPRNYAEFDYIFTGRNKDILNFDMKLQDLQWMLASNLELGAGAMAGVTEAGQSNEKEIAPNKTAELVRLRAYDPLLLPKNTQAELENFNRYSSLLQRDDDGGVIKSAQDYTRNLSMFYAASPITTVVTIRGNPDIMTKFNIGSFLPHRLAVTNTGSGNTTVNVSEKQKYRRELEEKIINDNTTARGERTIVRDSDGNLAVATLGSGSYTTSPVFVKINIKGPNVNFLTSELVKGEEFSKQILYDNYYVVMKVTNIIEAGAFRQELELFSHNVFGQGKLSAATQEKSVKTI